MNKTDYNKKEDIFQDENICYSLGSDPYITLPVETVGPRAKFDYLGIKMWLFDNKEEAERIAEEFTTDSVTFSVNKHLKPSYLKEQETNFFNFQSIEEVLNMPEKEWLVDKVFGAGDIGEVYGAPGCGKTFVVIDMIMSMSKGETWAGGNFKVARPLSVAYCAGEGKSGLGERFRSAHEFHEIKEMPLFQFSNEIPQLFDDSAKGSIDKFIEEWSRVKKGAKLDVLIIDTLHSAINGADENSNTDMGKVYQSCKKITKELGCAIILVHHTNKDGTADRGASSMRGDLDFMIEIKKGSTNSQMCSSKVKDAEKWNDIGFYLQKKGKSAIVRWNEASEHKKEVDEDKEALKSEMQKNPGVKFTAAFLSETTGQKIRDVRRLLNQLEEFGHCKKSLDDLEKSASSKNPWVFYVD